MQAIRCPEIKVTKTVCGYAVGEVGSPASSGGTYNDVDPQSDPRLGPFARNARPSAAQVHICLR